MNYKEILEQQTEIAKDLTKAQVRFSNIKVDIEGLKKDVIKVLSQQHGYENINEVLKCN